MRMLLKIRQHAKRFWADDRGQSTTEYILILAVVVMVAMRFRKMFLADVGKALTNLSTDLDQATQPDTSGN